MASLKLLAIVAATICMLGATVAEAANGCGYGWHRNCAGCRCVPN